MCPPMPRSIVFADLRHTSQTRLLLFALGAFALASVLSRLVAVVVVLAGAALMATSVMSSRAENQERSEDNSRAIVALIAIFAVFSLTGPVHEVFGSVPTWIFPISGITWLTLGIGWLAFGSPTRARRVIFFLVLVASAAIGTVHVISVSGVGYDVLFFHEAAADAIAAGVSPYSDAVRVPNGAPDGAPYVVGYPYPPSTAIAYSVGSWLGDARWTSLAAWLVTLAVIGSRSLRRVGSPVPLGVMVMVAALPGWPLVLTAAWSEPFSLALVAIAVVLWSKPRWSGGLVGLFVGSKQYLLAGAPLLATARVRRRWLRAGWAAVGLATSFLPVLVWGVPEFIDAAIGFHLDAPARPDGTSIVGALGAFGVAWVPPLWLSGAIVLTIAVVLGNRSSGLHEWLALLGVILTVALFLSAQAFPNYWFLIAGIAALAAVSSVSTAAPGARESESSEATTTEPASS